MTKDLLRDLARDLPFDKPDPARRDAVRSALLAEASEAARPDPRRRWGLAGAAFATGVLAAAAVALVIGRGGGDGPALQAPGAAQITASTEARLEHEVVATDTGVDEIVRVHHGTVKLAIAEVRPGNRVRVRTRDAEVDGGGVYEVVVDDETLRAVSVRSGTAEIKVTGQRAVMLAAGQTWRASIVTTDLSPVRTPDITPPAPAKVAVAPAPVVKPVPAPTPVHIVEAKLPDAPEGAISIATPEPARPCGVTVIEQRFQAGWALLKAGKARDAAHELGGAADTAPNDPLAADARYFQAVALVRAGERSEAERVLVKFLDSAP
ncbi:MAG: tetratricopeptide repeat protein, partial [Kofleriaceae bacterium]